MKAIALLRRYASAVWLLTVALVVLGLVSAWEMPSSIYPEVEFPRIVFKGNAVKWNGDAPALIEGQLTMLGVTRPIALNVERWKCQPDPRTAGKRYMCGGNATSSFKRSEFGMKFGIPAVGDEVQLWLSVEAFRD